mgnify:CR=1 FL=1
MEFKVIISPRAIRDLGQIVRYISLDDSKAVQRFGYTLIDEALSLSKLPDRGRLVPELDDGITREIIHQPYRIVYRVNHEQKCALVSRFWHGARLL